MKTKRKATILKERGADYGSLRAVLRDWGYEENEIHRVLEEERVDPKVKWDEVMVNQSTSAPVT